MYVFLIPISDVSTPTAVMHPPFSPSGESGDTISSCDHATSSSTPAIDGTYKTLRSGRALLIQESRSKGNVTPRND